MTTPTVPVARRRGRSGWHIAIVMAMAAGVLGVQGSVGAEPVAATPQAPADECSTDNPQFHVGEIPAFDALGIRQAWRYSQGQGVTVAVVDSGIAVGNVHFDGALAGGANLVREDDPEDRDAMGHGTTVAGIIGARLVDGSDVVGVAPQAMLQPVRAFYETSEEAEDDNVHLTSTRIADGIQWAAENGAQIINVSLSTNLDDPALAEAVATAVENGALVVASGGNRDTMTVDDPGPRYPAAYEDVLAVSPVDTAGAWHAAAIHPNDFIDVAAPGQHVPSAFYDAHDCIFMPGETTPSTSWATAYVSGVAALVAARYPEETAEQWAYRLMATASRASTGERDDQVGWGLIQPVAALQFIDDGSAPGPPSPVHGQAEPQPAPTADLNLTEPEDPMGPVHATTRWWLIGALAFCGLALLVAQLRSARRT